MKKKETFDFIKLILVGGIIIAALSLIGNSYELARDWGYTSSYKKGYNMRELHWAFTEQDYVELAYMVRINDMIQREDAQSAELTAMGHIYDNAVWYYVYTGKDEEKAAVCAENIAKYKAQIKQKVFLKEYEKWCEVYDLP